MTAATAPGRARQQRGSGRGLDVLIFYDCIYPHSLGGVEHRNLEMAKALAGRGHRVTLAGFSPEASEPAEGVRILPVAPPGRLYHASGRRSTRESLRLAAAAARIDLEPFDVVETANIPYAHLPPLALRCRLRGKPLLVIWYEYWGAYWRRYQGPVKWLPYAAVERLCARLGKNALAISRLTGDRLRRHRGSEEIEILPSGIAVDKIRDSARGAASGPPLVYAGRLMVEKRLDLLLRAVELLADAREGPLLTVIGDGPAQRSLADLVAHLGIGDRVEFLGRLPKNVDVWRRLGGARIAVQPSSREGFGLFPLEAMAAGLPVVYCTSPESALPELVEDGRQGVATSPNAEALAGCLERLLGDEEELRRLSRGARERADAFDWAKVAERFEEILFDQLER